MSLGYVYLSYLMKEIYRNSPEISIKKEILEFFLKKVHNLKKKKKRLNVDVFSVSINLNSKIIRCFGTILF